MELNPKSNRTNTNSILLIRILFEAAERITVGLTSLLGIAFVWLVVSHLFFALLSPKKSDSRKLLYSNLRFRDSRIQRIWLG
jgi:hypothetical protein